MGTSEKKKRALGMQQSALLTLYFVPKLYKLDFDIQKNDFDI
jgi:hypothetical protein